jgi:hypothetical protein
MLERRLRLKWSKTSRSNGRGDPNRSLPIAHVVEKDDACPTARRRLELGGALKSYLAVTERPQVFIGDET